MRMTSSLLLSGVLIACSNVAGAQAPPSPATPPARTAPPSPDRPVNCAPLPSQQGTTTGQRAEPLSDRLARSDGVLCPPPGIDPEIRAPTPETGNMPVIKPPGSPGGDPTIRPK
ncbi:MAG: hypothetical protein Q7U92_18925 [Bradyrhizobium sp.]|nr:hypothetical protein [Bradyrhizobium sp.]